MGDTVLQCCQRVPEGVLCFFPSYSLMDRVIQRWKATPLWKQLAALKAIMVEPR